MASKQRQLTIFPNVSIESRRVSHGLAATPGVAGITKNAGSRPALLDTWVFTSVVLSMLAAQDYGSVKLCDLPNANLIIIGTRVNLTGIVAGFASNVGTAVDLAIGLAATATIDFSGTNEKALVAKIDGTGAGTTSTIIGANTTTEKNLFVAAGASNAIYVNASDPVTTGTGTLTLSGTIEVVYFNTGAPT